MGLGGQAGCRVLARKPGSRKVTLALPFSPLFTSTTQRGPASIVCKMPPSWLPPLAHPLPCIPPLPSCFPSLLPPHLQCHFLPLHLSSPYVIIDCIRDIFASTIFSAFMGGLDSPKCMGSGLVWVHQRDACQHRGAQRRWPQSLAPAHRKSLL